MEKTKVISVRLPISTIQKIDEISNRYPYWKRNAILSQFIDCFAFACDEVSQSEIIRWWRHGGRMLDVQVTSKVGTK